MTNVNIMICLVIISCFLIQVSIEWKIFHKGRQIGGNIGSTAATTTTINHQTDLPKAQWFEQILDHFNPTDNRTWMQRYYTNEEFYNKSTGVNTPVFISIGGEGEINSTWMVEGSWIDYAKQHGALCFQLEHRYYGQSRPTKDMSTKNLQYLSSEQALNDLALFIESMNIQYGLQSPKWIAFGGSYPGSLAAWLRYKYPHLVVGAMSASGPLLAKLDFYEYFGVVEQALRASSSQRGDACVTAILAGTKQLDIMLKHMVGQRSIDQKFKLCDSITQSIDNQLDVSNLYETLSGNFANVVQYNKDNRLNGKYPAAANITIDTLCTIMTNDTLGVELNRLAAINQLTLDVYEQKCLDYKYKNMITALRNVSWQSEASEGGRQWMYQTCTEFGFYQTSTNKPQLFGSQFPVEFFIQQCIDIFGPKFNSKFVSKKIALTNIEYGALDLDVSNVVFVHGSVDPWHALGVTSTRNNNAPAIFINGTAHCANMYPSSPNDPPQLKAARLQIGQFIDSWIRLG